MTDATTVPASGPPRTDAPSRARAPLWLLGAGFLVCAGYFATEVWLVSWDLGFPLDDSWIHLQFARNLAAGHGLSYNPGEIVTGSTAPLWTALLALLHLLPGPIVVWTKLLGVALFLAGIDTTWRLARELGLASGLAALASGLTLATSWMVWSALAGMEIPLFVLISLWGMILHLRERARPARLPLSFAVLVLSVLARPEGFLLLLFAFLDRLLTLRQDGGTGEPLRWIRPPLRSFAVGAVLAASVLIGPLLFYAWAGDSVLPTTFAAKGGGGVRHLLPDLQYVYNALGIIFRVQPWATLFAGAGGAALLSRLGTSCDRGLLPALWVFGLPLAYSTLSPSPTHMMGNFGRYYFPLIPVVAVLGVLGLEPVFHTLGRRVGAGRLRFPVGALLVVGILAPTLISLFKGAQFYARNVANVQDSDVAIARWLGKRLPPQALLVVNDIGAIKYLLPNRIVDLVSIVTPDFRRDMDHGIALGATPGDAFLAAIERRHPDYLVIFPMWYPEIAASGRFTEIYSLEIRDNITMGAPVITVYSTPWTRYPLHQLPEDLATAE